MRVVAFLDYQCPHSRKVYNTIKELSTQEKGDLLRQFINLPLSYHLHAKEAALASLVADMHDKFELFSDKMFSTQHVWSSMDKATFSDYLLSVAKYLKIDESTFKRELTSATVKSKLRKQREIAKSLGVHITPASFVNGRYIRGAYPRFSFIATYDEEKQRADLHRKKNSLAGEELYSELVKNGEPFIHSASAQTRRTLFADDGDIYAPRLHGDEPQIGKKTTPLTVVLFVDYPCPYSRRGFMLLKKLQSEQKEKLHIVLKHLPLRSAPSARKIALYAITVNSLYGAEAYLKTVTLLFSRQKEMRRLKKVDLFLKKLTEDVGLEWEKIVKKIHTPEISLILTKDIDEAQRLHVTGVPTLFINGKKIKGVKPISWFRKAINKRAEEMKERPLGSSNK
jgi:protein-disulfide isomerase